MLYLRFYKFRFRLGAFNPNMSFPLCKCTKIDQSEPKWTEWAELDQMEQSGSNRDIGPKRLNRTIWTE